MGVEFKVADGAWPRLTRQRILLDDQGRIEDGLVAPPADEADVLAGQVYLHGGGQVFGDVGDEWADARVAIVPMPFGIGFGGDAHFKGGNRIFGQRGAIRAEPTRWREKAEAGGRDGHRHVKGKPVEVPQVRRRGVVGGAVAID